MPGTIPLTSGAYGCADARGESAESGGTPAFLCLADGASAPFLAVDDDGLFVCCEDDDA